MFLRKTKSAPILKPSSTFSKENDRLNRNVIYLQTMIDDMIQEYQYMDRPLKYSRNPEPSPINSITDKIIIHRQPTTEMKYLKATDRNNLFKETNFVKTVTFPLSTSHPWRYVFPHS